MSDQKWDGKSKANTFGYLFFIYTIRILPLSINYVFLRFISYFYFLFTPDQRNNLKQFYAFVFKDDHPQKNSDRVKQNYYMFAQSIVDRVAFQIGKRDRFTFEFDGHQAIEDCLKKGKGLVLLGSHLGNWEIAGEMLNQTGIKAKVNVLLLDQEKEQIKAVLEKHKDPNSFEIIPIKEDLSHIIKLKHVVDQNEIVCILGDRFIENSRTLSSPFCGQKLELPLGVFKFIERTKTPTLFFFNMKTGNFNYKLYAIHQSKSGNVHEIADDYARKLEEKVYEYPEQFYNYHLFLKLNEK